jgi:hypothetical protein
MMPVAVKVQTRVGRGQNVVCALVQHQLGRWLGLLLGRGLWQGRGVVLEGVRRPGRGV